MKLAGNKVKSKIAGIIMSAMAVAFAVAPMSAQALTPSGQQITQSDYLKAEDGYLKNQDGEVVALRGVNAGGWLIQESWMCPINGADRAWANLDTINTLKNRGFSDQQIQTLFDTYQDNWFTTIDLDNLKAMGVNCVRVPFWYRNFMSDENGTWITGNDLNSNPGIKRLDWVIEECGKRGMYVILDCHGAPGGQSMDHCCGTLCKNELYDSTKNRAILKDLWTKIATRYKGNPIVAAYDIMNEPQNNGGYSGSNAWAPGSSEALSRTYSVYDEMYKAIRAVDPDHVISMEAIWEGSCLPDPDNYGWSNLLYQMHIYDTSQNMIDTRVNELKYFQSQYGTAVYVGEFNCDPHEEYAMTKFNEAGINWTTWAYKGAKQSVGNNWFLYVKNIPYVDANTDSYETMLSKWGSVLKTSNFDVNTNTVKAWIVNHVDDPVAGPPKPADIPGKIEAENYTSMSGIQTENCSEGGQNVGYIEAGDWMDYSVNVSAKGSYKVEYRVASTGSTGQIQLKANNTTLATTDVPNTGDWQNWQTISTTVTLEKGTQTLRLYANGGGFNINYIQLTKVSDGESSDGGSTEGGSGSQGGTTDDGSTETTSDAVWMNHFETSTGFSAGANASVTSDNSSANNGGSKSVKLVVNNSGDPGNNQRCVNIKPATGSTINASGKNYLIFNIKDTQGANTVKITIVDSNNSEWSVWTSAQSTQNQWKKMSIALSSVSGIDLSKVKEVRIGEWNSGTYYLDDVYFAEAESDAVPAFN